VAITDELRFNLADMVQSRRLWFWELHGAVLLFGFTGLFGKFLHISPMMIVLGRSAFAAVSLGTFLSLTGKFPSKILSGHFGLLIVSGLILAFHWVSFFRCVQISTVAVGVLTFSTSPVFSTLIEPFVFKERWNPATLLPVALVILGVVCLVPSTNFGNHIVLGACWGTASGLAFALYTLLNRLQVRKHSPQMLSFGQNMVVAGAMLMLTPFYSPHAGPHDIALLAVLGILCTAIAQSLYIASLRGVSAQLACVVSTLEAPYGILFALILLREIPTRRSIVGGVVILSAAVLATRMQGQPVHHQSH
jgi:drug/metabolite transporter (DMT)-like permease